MSYDITLIHPVYKDERVEVGNYTSNVVGMWYKALGDKELCAYDGLLAKEATADMARAISAMFADPDAYTPMEPSNGWGDYEGAVDFLIKLWKACLRYPDYRISMCY